MGKLASAGGICRFEACDRPVHCRGWCKAHYEQQRRGYELRPLLATIPVSCRIEGCDREIVVRRDRLCRLHYERKQRLGWTSLESPLSRQCEFCGHEFVPRRNNTTKCCSARCQQKNARLFGEYGLRGVDVREMLALQEGGCAICLRKIEFNGFANDITAIHIDHCHQSGDVRGLLCGPCNRGLGLFNDDPTRVLAAASYLKRYAK